jgi:gliding motility-associated-like protein
VIQRIAVILVLLALTAARSAAQPANALCSHATLLCAQQPVSGSNVLAGGTPGFCPATDAMVWYTFITNSQGGDVTVSIDAIDCVVTPGTDNELSAVVLTGNGSCDLNQFGAASTCGLDTIDFSVTAPGLAPATRYWVLVSGAVNNGALAPAQCGFSVLLSGPGADIVGVDMSAGPDVTIGSGESARLQGVGNTFEWSPTAGLSSSTGPDPIAAPSGTTRYTLNSEINGCMYQDEMTVFVIRRVDPPNTFTPNDDGYNDKWEIPGIADFPGAEVLIHDRWGQVVFRSNGYRDPWDGTHNGRKLSVGTYYYHIQLNQLEGRSPPYTGFVTIVR